jgi:hypothetical protein
MLNAPAWILWLGLVGALLAGFCLRWWANARRFERRNALGIEQFESYGDLMSSRFLEALAGIVGNLMLAAALCLLLLIAAQYLPGR